MLRGRAKPRAMEGERWGAGGSRLKKDCRNNPFILAALLLWVSSLFTEEKRAPRSLSLISHVGSPRVTPMKQRAKGKPLPMCFFLCRGRIYLALLPGSHYNKMVKAYEKKGE